MFKLKITEKKRHIHYPVPGDVFIYANTEYRIKKVDDDGVHWLELGKLGVNRNEGTMDLKHYLDCIDKGSYKILQSSGF